MAEIEEIRLTQAYKARISHGQFQSFMSWIQKNQIDTEQLVPLSLSYELMVHVPLSLVEDSTNTWGDKKDCFWEPIL